MYARPGVIYGFHVWGGVGEAILASYTRQLNASENTYDWLCNGIYFGEASPERVLELAREATVQATHR